MKTAQALLQQIRRKQLLVCASTMDCESSMMDVDEIASLLRMDVEECRQLARRLEAKGLISLVQEGDTISVVPSERSRRLVARMAAVQPALPVPS